MIEILLGVLWIVLIIWDTLWKSFYKQKMNTLEKRVRTLEAVKRMDNYGKNDNMRSAQNWRSGDAS